MHKLPFRGRMICYIECTVCGVVWCGVAHYNRMLWEDMMSNLVSNAVLFAVQTA